MSAERVSKPEASGGRTSERASTRAGRAVVQPKLRVGAADDVFEREADRMAAEFLAWQRSAPATDAASAEPAGPPSRVQRADGVRRVVQREEKGPGLGKLGAATVAADVAVVEADKIPAAAQTAFDGTKAAATSSEGQTGGEIAGEFLGLLQGVTSFVDACRVLFSAHANHAGEDQLVAAERLVTSTGSMLQKSVAVAETAKATVVATLLPGLDIAVGLLATLLDFTRLFQLRAASKAESATLDAARATANAEVLAATTLIHSRTARQLTITLVNLAADLTIVGGAVAQLAVGPVGAAVKGVGGLVKLGAFVANQVLKSKDGKAAGKAEAAYDEALAGGDADAVAEANTARLAADDAFAVREILSLAVTPDGGGKLHPELTEMVAAYGIGPNWLQRYADAGKPPAMLLEAEQMMLRFLGKDPKSALGKVTKAMGAAWKWVSTKTGLSDPDPAKRAVDTRKACALIANPVVKAYVASSGATATPAELTRALAATVTKLRLTYVTATEKEDVDVYLDQLDAVDGGLYDAVVAVGLPGVSLGSIDVVDGAVTFDLSAMALVASVAGPSNRK